MRVTDERDKQIAELEKAYYAVQEMLAWVLDAVGEPVMVTKERMSKGLPENVTIDIDDNLPMDAFVFSLKEVNG